MERSFTKIVVIHDGLIPKVDPLLVELNNKFNERNVIHFENSNKGLEYVLDNLNQKMVVLLDINFSKEEKTGIQVFEEIRKTTALVYVILITANEYYKIPTSDLILLINHDAFAIENVTSDYTKIVALVESASHKLDTRVDSALERWIASHPENEKNVPYIISREGQSYTLSQLLEEIRKQTPFGMEMEKDILLLAIDMLSRGKKKIDG